MFGYIVTFATGAAIGGMLVAANHKSVQRAAAAARKQAIFDCERRQGEINAAYRRGVYDFSSRATQCFDSATSPRESIGFQREGNFAKRQSLSRRD